MLQERAPLPHRLQQRKLPARPRNGKDQTREPSARADVNKPDSVDSATSGGGTAAVHTLQRGQHGERVGHVARHDLGLVGDGGEVHSLVPFKESVHVDGDLALLRRREGGGGGRGGGGYDGRGGPEVEEVVTRPVASAEEEAREENAAAGGGAAAAAERHLSLAAAAAAATSTRRGLGIGMGFVMWISVDTVFT